MYLYRRCNQNYQYRQNRPVACKPEEPIPRHEPLCFFQTACAGGINLSGAAGIEKEYDLLFMRLDFSLKNPTTAVLNFACNITFLNAKADIRIQLVKSGVCQPVPVAAPAVYRRTLEYSGSDAVFFTTHDLLPAQAASCGYLIKMHVTGNTSEDSMILITNPVLTAIIL